MKTNPVNGCFGRSTGPCMCTPQPLQACRRMRAVGATASFSLSPFCVTWTFSRGATATCENSAPFGFQHCVARVRSLIEQGQCDPSLFRAELTGIRPVRRDAWVDRVFGLDAPPDDGPALPVGCVPYLPCPVDVLLRLAENASVRASDLF